MEEKIKYSIELIKKAENLALAMNESGFFVGFSGGKDSQVLLQLVKMSGVKYTAHYNVTTNDPVDNVNFIKTYYPEVVFDKPNRSFLQIVEKRGLPTQFKRFCCAELKETKGVGHVVLTGVRASESRKRASYQEITKWGKHKNEIVKLDEMQERQFQCVNGKDKFMIYPILHWNESDVWDFIKKNNLPINPCYRLTRRVGCVFCPYTSKRQVLQYIQTHPKLYTALLHSLQTFLDNNNSTHRNQFSYFQNAEDCFNWWIEKISVKEYMERKKQLTLSM